MTEQKTLSGRAWAELVVLSLIWGGSFLSIRVALDEIGVLTSVAHRCGWAMLILWGVVALRRLPLPRSAGLWGAFLVMGLLNNIIPFGLMAWGQLYIETGLTSIFNASTAIFGALVAALVFADERLTRRKIIGVALGFAGVITVLGIDSLRSFNITSLAQLAVIGGTLSYAFAGAWGRIHLAGLHPIVASAGMLTASTLIMVPAAWVFEGPIRMDLQAGTWLAIGYYAVIATALAYVFYYRVLGMAGSANVMLCTLMIAPIAVVLGAVVRAEQLPWNAYAGFAILALGLLVLSGRLLRRL
ncbi:DMT family transporter [Nereida sp. MMG025]|uniref:DMT family transporter n=1 Tax=Nereida sp. MMG025 TaxID=2909981 RepID=UPI001F2B658F|nr:DMT family transporter [Nereida sp. MMG025]MCF6443253.1 DMT family transporter [Nereida sp. MMG025]